MGPADEVRADTYPDIMVWLAREKKLHEHRYWQVLLHYEETLSGKESLIDDPRFFLSPDGKHDPASELEATIRSFFRKDLTGEDHPICRFIARYEWLREELAMDASELPVSACGKFDQVLGQLKPKTATLVFPTYFMNSPASMFGHTLINIETDYKSKLLSHAVNYAAVATDTNGLLFAIKGLSGLYKGYYSILPYYQKIQEYSDISQRDMWEYQLNLTASEVGKMVRHIWELRNIFTDYYFFDENCSYNLLFLLESARPSLRLAERFPLWVVPIDTVKAMKAGGVIDTARFRPSKATKIRHKISRLSPENQRLSLDIIHGRQAPHAICDLGIKKAEQIRIMDLAAEYVQYQYAKKKMPKDQYQNILLSTLRARSELGKPDEDLYDIPVPPQPDKVHDSSRFHIGLGIQEDRLFQEIGCRPVFGDLLDTDYEQDQGVQLEFGDTRFRYYPDDKRFRLESADFIDIISISSRDEFFQPYSWKARTGFVQKKMSDGRESLIYHLNTGAGLASYDDCFGLCYVFAEPELNLGGALEGNYSLGMGASVGMLKRITPSWKCHLFARKMYFELGEAHCSTEVSLSQYVRLNRNRGISFDMRYKKVFGSSYGEARVTWNVHF